MWNVHNKALVDRYGFLNANPSDTEYGEYIMRELMTLGFSVKRLNMSGGSNFVIALDLMGGDVRVVLLCKTSSSVIDMNSVQALMALRSMYKAAKHVILTNRSLDETARRAAQQNRFVLVEEFYIGCDVLDVLAAVGLFSESLANRIINYRQDEEERARRSEEERRLQLLKEEEDRKKRHEFRQDEVKQMTPMEKYQNGLYSPVLPDAIAVVSLMDVVSIGGLARKMHIDQDDAKELLLELAELGVVGPAERSKPREVIMTAGMIEKKFGIRIRTGLR